MSKKRVLITGGAGYLADFVAAALRQFCQVTLMDRIAPPAADRRADLPFVRADVTAYDQVKAACKDQHLVVHLIALVRQRFGMPTGLHCDVM